MNKSDVSIFLDMDVTREQFQQAAERSPVKAAESLSREIAKFEEWVIDRGMDPLTKLERQILREYLGYKLVS